MGFKEWLMGIPPAFEMGGGAVNVHTKLTARLKVLGEDGEYHYAKGGKRVIHNRVMTTDFVDFFVDQLQAEGATWGDFKYHACGLGVGAEVVGDSTLGTDSGITRVAGSQVETDHDTYKSVAEMTMDTTEAITEHGLFNASTSGVLMDRTLFSAINVVSGNKIEFTFEASFTAGG